MIRLAEEGWGHPHFCGNTRNTVDAKIILIADVSSEANDAVKLANLGVNGL